MSHLLRPNPAEIRIVPAQEQRARYFRLWGTPPLRNLPANVFTLPPLTDRRRVRAIGEEEKFGLPHAGGDEASPS